MERLRGIVLRTVKYGDSSIIIDMLTDGRGRMSVITRRTSRPSADRSRIAPSHLMPLSLLEFDCHIHGQGRLPHPNTIICYHPYTTLQSHPVKATLALFIAEFLSYALKEETANHLLYDYLEQSFRWLDTAEHQFANFHLVLLMRLTRFIGIMPSTQKTDSSHYFDLMNSEYTTVQPPHSHFLQPDEASRLPYMLHMDYDNMHLYALSRHQRRRCLEIINEYYRLHLPGFRELQSIEILSEVFG